MANKKISEMTYKQLAADDMIPSVNPTTDPTENYNFLGADIPLLVGVSQWDAAATYAAGHIVIYNTSTIKGMFLVTATTSAGDAPDGAGYTKFNSIGLSWVRNNTAPLTNASPTVDIGYLRTKEITINQTASTTATYTITSNLALHNMGTKVNIYTSNDPYDITVNYIDIQNLYININITTTTGVGSQGIKVLVQIDG